MTTDYFSLMLSIARDGGKIALELIDTIESKLKPDASVITEADLRISALVHERLSSLLKTGDHILVDEEDPRKVEYLDEGVLAKAQYLWSVDPIDGTRAYANRMPHYGISLGLLKDCRPYMGVVFFPSLGELFTCDGKDAWFIRNAFTDREIRTKIVPIDQQITSRSVFIATDEILTRFTWDQKECCVMIFSSAVTEFCWPAIGRAVGSLSMVHLWDFVGSWAIFEKAGLKLRAFNDGRVLDKISANLFHKDDGSPWQLREYYILSSERNYPELRKLLQPKERS